MHQNLDLPGLALASHDKRFVLTRCEDSDPDSWRGKKCLCRCTHQPCAKHPTQLPGCSCHMDILLWPVLNKH
jgi:hypothetical protein